jgi:hypothetical protein
MIKNKSKNLFDGYLELGGIFNATGLNETRNDRIRTDYIQLLPSTTYSLSGNFVGVTFFYNSSKTFLSLTVDQTFTTPSTTTYIRIRFNGTQTDIDNENSNGTIQIELGSTATAYIPYNDIQVAVGQFEQAVLTDRFLSVHNPASNDIPIPALNNKTLNEVFVGGNLVVNNEFTNGTTGWILNNASVINNEGVLLTTVNATAWLRQNLVVTTNTYYVRHDSRYVSGATANWGVYFGVDFKQQFNLTTTMTTKSLKATHSGSFTSFSLGNLLSNTISQFVVDNIYLLNLTSLGIASQTQAQMDAYFEAWQRNNAGTLLANTFIQHDQNSVPIADLNGKTLDEVFIGGQLISNSDFDTGITGWTTNNATNTYVNGNLISTSSNASINGRAGTLVVSSGSVGHTYYTVIKSRVINPNATFLSYGIGHLNTELTGSAFAFIEFPNPVENEYYIFSLLGNSTSTGEIRVRAIQSYATPTIANGKQMEIEYAYAYNLTALGITATKAQLDFWYSVWQQNHKLGMRVHRASGNDIPLAVLNNQSLNQVFNSNLVTLTMNNILTTGLWSLPVVTLTSYQNFYVKIHENNYPYNYLRINTRQSNASGSFVNWIPLDNLSVIYQTYVVTLFIEQTQQTDLTKTISVVYVPLDTLGIATLTQSQLDYLFQVWQFNQVNALVARQFIQEA